MIHRHLRVPAGTPPRSLASAAIVDLLERGDLDDWRPLAAEIAREPEGELADRVLRLVDAYPAYGVSPLFRAWIGRLRDRAEGRRSPPPASDLASLRRRAGLTQAELAARVGMSQSDLSKLERRRDVRLSTLRAFVDALGGRLRVICDLPGGVREVLLSGPAPRRVGSAGRTTPDMLLKK